MGIGVSLFLIAAGAVLAFAVNATTDAANLDTVGFILMAVGGLGLLISLLIFGGGAWRRDEVPTERVIERRERI